MLSATAHNIGNSNKKQLRTRTRRTYIVINVRGGGGGDQVANKRMERTQITWSWPAMPQLKITSNSWVPANFAERKIIMKFINESIFVLCAPALNAVVWIADYILEIIQQFIATVTANGNPIQDVCHWFREFSNSPIKCFCTWWTLNASLCDSCRSPTGFIVWMHLQWNIFFFTDLTALLTVHGLKSFRYQLKMV